LSRILARCLSKEEASKREMTISRAMSNKGSASIVIAPNIFKPNVPMIRKRRTRGASLRRKREKLK
jgi:hypothetical protein